MHLLPYRLVTLVLAISVTNIYAVDAVIPYCTMYNFRAYMPSIVTPYILAKGKLAVDNFKELCEYVSSDGGWLLVASLNHVESVQLSRLNWPGVGGCL